MKICIFLFVILNSISAFAVSLPVAPTNPAHPGSKIYSYSYEEKAIKCNNRNVSVVLPISTISNETFALVVYGHGQALDYKHYKTTFLHLAQKGIAVAFPDYDTGFFDQDWNRMGKDYVELTECTLNTFPQLDASAIIYSGHSKGAYIASIAAGLAYNKKSIASPKTTILFAAAGADSSSLKMMDPLSSLVVVYSDADTIVKKSLSEQIYTDSAALKKQFIDVKSYTQTTPTLKADHYWPQTEAGLLGGGKEGALHYYGSWKWLVAGGWDLKSQQKFTNSYLYDTLAADKGISGFEDTIIRNW